MSGIDLSDPAKSLKNMQSFSDGRVVLSILLY